MIRACLECGRDTMEQLTISDGLAAGAGENTGKMVCRSCGWQGVPLEFEDQESHAAFAGQFD